MTKPGEFDFMATSELEAEALSAAANESRGYLLRQFDIAWKLASFHLEGLTTEECLWQPADKGPHVRKDASGVWRADWPEHEGYDLGPPSIGWLTWHMGFWWAMVLDHSFGTRSLTRASVPWPGGAAEARDWITRLSARWRDSLEHVTEYDVRAMNRTQWPFKERSFGDVIAWVNLELMKNAAELGYARFLYAVR